MKVAVTPVGVIAERATNELKPLMEVTLTVVEAEDPLLMMRLEVVVDRE